MTKKSVYNHGKISKFSSVCHTCGLCESDFCKRMYFVLHIKAHDIVNEHLCNTCGKIFPTLEHLKDHVRLYHTMIYPCVQCDKYVKNADMCDMTIFNSAKTKYYKK